MSSDELLSPRRMVQEFNGVFNAQTLANWRHTRERPDLPFTRVGRKIFYRRSDVIAFLNSNTVGQLRKEA